MTDSEGRRGNPAERPDVEVHRPKKLTNVKYSPEGRYVKNLNNGDALVLRAGHAGGPGQYTYSNEKTGLIAYGDFKRWSGGDLQTVGYEILNLKTEHATGAPFRSRSEFNIARMAELFRALRELQYHKAQPLSKVGFTKTVLVLDRRPESGVASASQEAVRRDS